MALFLSLALCVGIFVWVTFDSVFGLVLRVSENENQNGEGNEVVEDVIGDEERKERRSEFM